MNSENFDSVNFARVHSIESFGTLDGPGVRFLLFLQGCSLKCKYCHNRDTWDIGSGQIMSVDEIYEKILKYKNYIKKGGITVTGGEPLLQQDFLITLFKKLKKAKIHTCVDTSGMFPLTDKLKKLIDLTDLFLLDIKHIDSKKCQDLTGHPNEKELEFAKYLDSINKPIWIRQVLVPDYTDDEQDLLKLKDFLNSLNNVQKFEFLPYHTLGKNKWTDLGYKYELENIKPATSEDVERAKKIIDL